MPKSIIEQISEALQGQDPRIFQPIQPDLAWGDIDRYLAGRGQGGISGQDDIDALIAAALGDGAGGYNGYGGGGYGGGGGAVPWGSTQAAAELAQQFALEQLGLEQQAAATQLASEQQFAMDQAQRDQMARAEEAERQREFERQRALEELKAERLRIFTEMRGTDPVRAALFAMGVGGESTVGGRFAELPPLAGAGKYGRQVESGLEGILGGDIGIGQGGVTGLPSAIKAATAFSAGQGVGGNVGNLDAARTLLLSGLGVGYEPSTGKPMGGRQPLGIGMEKRVKPGVEMPTNIPSTAAGIGAAIGLKPGRKPVGGAPGMSREEILRQISSVTPTGAAFRGYR